MEQDLELRYSRNSELISQERLNSKGVAIVGCGAIGSQVAYGLARMGVSDIALIDFDRVGEENISTQGFNENDIGKHKVFAVQDNLTRINSEIILYSICGEFNPTMIKERNIFSCVDSMKSRKDVFNAFCCSRNSDILIDTRMAAESFELYSATRADKEEYKDTLFSDSEAFQQRCTAKSTIYTAMIVSGFACGSYKRHVMGNFNRFLISGDIATGIIS